MSSSNSHLSKPFLALLVVLTVAAAGAGIFLGRKYFSPPKPPTVTNGTLLSPAKTLAPFKLQDDQGHPFGPAQLKGHWTFMFFGYTHCPDVCPNAMAMLRSMVAQLQKTPGAMDHTRVVFVSVDPQRDTPKVLGEYVRYFNPHFIGVTGTPDELAGITHQLGVVYHREKGGGKNYTIDHSAGMMLMNPDGRYTAYFGPPQDASAMARDFIKIRQYYEANK